MVEAAIPRLRGVPLEADMRLTSSSSSVGSEASMAEARMAINALPWRIAADRSSSDKAKPRLAGLQVSVNRFDLQAFESATCAAEPRYDSQG